MLTVPFGTPSYTWGMAVTGQSLLEGFAYVPGLDSEAL
jgi:hypothetical protein